MKTDWTETHNHIWMKVEQASYESPFIENMIPSWDQVNNQIKCQVMYIDYQLEEAIDVVVHRPLYHQLMEFHSSLAEE